mmetsp:Transcript_19160/g.53219  ORF Transcript_19160/g.53219 Transcript_19160/m.53219 type:complete len:181 (-) Transcript_19160:597-1139(-)
MPSSLQLASRGETRSNVPSTTTNSNNSNNSNNNKSNATKEKQCKGQFESCFASGLDLSEFTGGASKGKADAPPTQSASSQLLKTKLEEKRIREVQQQEEVKMNAVLAQRIATMKQQATNKKSQADHFLVSALVNMHSTDHAAVHRKGKKRSSQTLSHPTSASRSAKGVKKKKQAAKFRRR